MPSQAPLPSSDASAFDFRDERLDTAAAAYYLGISEAFLRNNNWSQRYPIPYVRVGRRVFYLKRDLDQFLLSQPTASKELP